MDCNKDEAMRAKSIAESKLEQNDFTGAIKFALKARTLYPGLDGISQMLTTLDVHVSAEKKIKGLVDWYGVLRVDPTADDETINKRYRKLALVLHPDKNKSVGAHAAFKLVSEAKSLLLDKDRRMAYDLITGREERFRYKAPSEDINGPVSGRTPTSNPYTRADDPSGQTTPPSNTTGPSTYSRTRPATGTPTVDPSVPSMEMPSFTGCKENFRHKVPSANTKRPSSSRAPTSGLCAHTVNLSAHIAPPSNTDGTGGQSTYSWTRPPAWARTDDPSEPAVDIPSFTSVNCTKQSPNPKKTSVKSGPSGHARAPKRADTFWTFCHLCGMQFEYLRIYCNTILCCPNCTKSFISLEIPRPTVKSRSHKPKPWPPCEQSPNVNNARTTSTKCRGKNIPDARKLGNWETGSDSFAYATYNEGRPFGKPFVRPNAAYYTKPDESDGIEGLFKKQKLDDFGGFHGNSYNVPRGDVDFGKAGLFGSGSFGFAGRCNAYVDQSV